MKTFKTILHGLFIALLLIVAGFFLMTVLPIHGNLEVKIVKSGSMEPAIKTGGIVVIKPGGPYAVGEIITFGADTNSAVPTTHRIISVEQAGGATLFETKGDANPKPDPEKTDSAAIIGHVLFTVPYAGYVLDFARQPVGFALLIGVPAALVILYELIGIIEQIRVMSKRRKENSSGGQS